MFIGREIPKSTAINRTSTLPKSIHYELIFPAQSVIYRYGVRPRETVVASASRHVPRSSSSYSSTKVMKSLKLFVNCRCSDLQIFRLVSNCNAVVAISRVEVHFEKINLDMIASLRGDSNRAVNHGVVHFLELEAFDNFRGMVGHCQEDVLSAGLLRVDDAMAAEALCVRSCVTLEAHHHSVLANRPSDDVMDALRVQVRATSSTNEVSYNNLNRDML